LLEAPATIIHGEYYPHNVMYDRRRGAIRPVDWESAALGPAEIDLASLTERWPEQTVRDCTREYLRTRRPEGDGAMVTPESRMDAARAYLHFRWLGEDPRRTADPKRRWRFEELRRSAERLGVL
jgi:aminoglycoside phosphotransferase (APT) family kinase protein